MNIKNKEKNSGFTLIEMIVSLGLFTIIVLISLGAFLIVLGAQRKSASIGIIHENLRFTIEMMAKEIRTGTSYYCAADASDFGNGSNVRDCAGGGNMFTFYFRKNVVIYRVKNNILQKYKNSYTSPDCPVADPYDDDCFLNITFPEMEISDLTFYVSGSAIKPNTEQPKITITLKGTIGKIERNSKSDFNIQTTVSQRRLDV